MIPTFGPSRSRLRLLAAAALLIAVIAASCCPPALVDRGIEKNNKPVAAKKASP